MFDIINTPTDEKQVVLQVPYAVKLASEEAPVSETSHTNKGIFSTQAPLLTETEGNGSSYLEQLGALMTEILFAITQLNETQSKLSESANKVSGDMTVLAKEQIKHAEEAHQKVLDAIAKAKKMGLLGKIFGGMASVLMIVLGAVTFNPALVASGVVIGLYQLTPAEAEFNKATQNWSPWAKFGVLAAITVAMTIATAGGGAAISAGAIQAEQGATFASRAALYLTATGNTTANVAFIGTQMAVATNLFSPLLEGIFTAAGMSKEKAKFVAQIVSIVVGMIALLVTGKMSNLSLADKPLTDKGVKLMQTFTANWAGKLHTLTFMAMGASGWCGVNVSDAHKSQAKHTEETAAVNSLFTFIVALAGIFNEIMSQTTDQAGANTNALGKMDWSGFVPDFDGVRA